MIVISFILSDIFNIYRLDLFRIISITLLFINYSGSKYFRLFISNSNCFLQDINIHFFRMLNVQLILYSSVSSINLISINNLSMLRSSSISLNTFRKIYLAKGYYAVSHILISQRRFFFIKIISSSFSLSYVKSTLNAQSKSMIL